MIEALKKKNVVILIFSLLSLYLLAPILERDMGMWVSFGFALVLILSSHVIMDRKHILKYILYILISMVTYYILFNDQPWDYFFDGGLFESSPIPLFFCSISMSLAGGLLLTSASDRVLYAAITLGVQIPIAIIIGEDLVQYLFHMISHNFHYQDDIIGNIQVWQLEWMVTYYLPIYFLNHRDRFKNKES